MPALSPALQFEVAWSGEAEILLPASHGTLRFQEAIGQGISVKKLRSGVVTVRPPRTGELVQLDATRPHKKLNILMQEHGVPPWQRRLMPLLFCGGDLVCVPGVEVAGAYRAQQDEIGLMVTWTMPCAE
jgi:tRNA(Ile)-lysidine synthase